MSVFACRPVREDLAADRRQEDGEEKDAGVRANSQPDLQRTVHVSVSVRARSPGVASSQRHGQGQVRSQRADRTSGAGRQERSYRGQTLERHVRQDTAARRAMACTQGLPVNQLSILISGSALTQLNTKLQPVARAVRNRIRAPRTYGLDLESISESRLRVRITSKI